jgi:hypothetical protein
MPEFSGQPLQNASTWQPHIADGRLASAAGAKL